jgi:hypothetical protein
MLTKLKLIQGGLALAFLLAVAAPVAHAASNEQALAFAHLRNAALVASGKRALPVQNHQEWARGQSADTLARESARLLDIIKRHANGLDQNTLAETHAWLKGAAFAGSGQPTPSIAQLMREAQSKDRASLHREVIALASR